ncbi:hypothetical protein KHM83_19575, partial [Fusibacter paucivorans]
QNAVSQVRAVMRAKSPTSLIEIYIQNVSVNSLCDKLEALHVDRSTPSLIGDIYQKKHTSIKLVCFNYTNTPIPNIPLDVTKLTEE